MSVGRAALPTELTILQSNTGTQEATNDVYLLLLGDVLSQPFHQRLEPYRPAPRFFSMDAGDNWLRGPPSRISRIRKMALEPPSD